MARLLRPAWPVGIAAAMGMWSGGALAQANGQDVAAAQALFEDGKRLMQAGNYTEGCPKLVESQRLDPGGGTLLAIAMCHEAMGRTATAWADFKVAAGEARKDHRADREAAAVEKGRLLEPRLVKVRIVVEGKAEGLEVRRDGAAVGAAQWGTPVPVDPGEHTLEARAPGKVTWQGTVTVAGEGRTLDAVIPALADAPPPVAVVVPAPVQAAPASGMPPSSAPASAEPHGSSGVRTWSFVVGGASIVVLGVGTAFGLSASSKWHDAQSACPGNRCPGAASAQLGTDAGHAADLSTVFLALGGVGLGAAVAMFVLSPSDHAGASPSPSALRVSPLIGRANGLAIGGDL